MYRSIQWFRFVTIALILVFAVGVTWGAENGQKKHAAKVDSLKKRGSDFPTNPDPVGYLDDATAGMFKALKGVPSADEQLEAGKYITGGWRIVLIVDTSEAEIRNERRLAAKKVGQPVAIRHTENTYELLAGNFRSKEEASQLLTTVKRRGYPKAKVTQAKIVEFERNRKAAAPVAEEVTEAVEAEATPAPAVEPAVSAEVKTPPPPPVVEATPAVKEVVPEPVKAPVVAVVEPTVAPVVQEAKVAEVAIEKIEKPAPKPAPAVVAPVAPVAQMSAVTMTESASTKPVPVRTKDVAPAGKFYQIQVGGFKNEAWANKYRDKIAETCKYPVSLTKRGDFWCVRVGEFTSSETAEHVLDSLKNNGHPVIYIVNPE